ncbi:MAG TPA: hypothetical protein VN578_08840 [Candidatus Binatia bacterium]|jgi:hypothetical protein|nr:hypothetical protein [Candidatus Binatia bacterium]
MPIEPERPIEKLLRAWAKKRRQQASERSAFDLHPATRRLLQGEVSRRFARKEDKPRWINWFNSRVQSRLAWGLAVLTLLGVAGFVLVPLVTHPQKDVLLAKNEPTAQPGQAPQVQAAGAADDAVALADKRAAVPGSDLKADRAASGAREQPALDRSYAQIHPESERSRGLAGALRQNATMPLQPESNDLKRGEETKVPALSEGLAVAPTPPPPGPQSRLAVGGATPLANSPAAASEPATLRSMSTLQQEKKEIAPNAAAESAFTRNPQGTGLAGGLAARSLSTDHAGVNLLGETSNESRAFSVIQRFAQTAQVTKAKDTTKAFPNGPILVSFRLEQKAQDVRIVDSDGSIYTGSLQPQGAVYRLPSTASQRPALATTFKVPKASTESVVPAAAPAGKPVAPSYFSFSVAGTNRSLNQRVVFSGELLSLTNPASLTDALTVRGDADLVMPAAAQLGAALPNYRISGTVLVGNGQPVEINALPVK